VSRRRVALLVAAGALLLAASYPPFPLPLLSFVAVAPAVVLLRAASAAREPRRAFRWGVWYGAASQGLVLYWMVIALWHFTPLSALGYGASVAVLTVYSGVLFWFVTLAVSRARVPLALAFPVAWTALEWWVGHQGDIRFPWLGLGTSLADWPLVVQWADLAGARGVTFWVAWVNVALVDGIAAALTGRGRTGEGGGGVEREAGSGKRWAPLAAVAATLVLASAYGVWRTRTLPVREAGVVGMIQPNESFDEKWTRPADAVFAKLIRQTHDVYALSRPQLIVWPEAAIPGYVQVRPAWDSAVTRLARERHTPVLAGGLYADFHDDGTYDYYNAALFYDSTGTWRRYPVYRKHYLVPVTERVPFVPVSWFRKVPSLQHWSGGFARGRELPLYPTAIGRFGVVICYESAFEDLARRYRRAGADFLVNITNDAWFGRSTAPAQHASHLVLRAIETRMGIARAANSGITQFVDPLGRAYASTALETETIVADRLRTTDVRTLYTRLGDWVGGLSLAGTLAMIAMVVWRRRE
jgi:apolipoprotein N-acyltransferase